MAIETIFTVTKIFFNRLFMFSILVPIDYQQHTESTLKYAVKFANKLGAELLLFHSFQLPLVSAETAYVQYPLEELYEDNKIALEKIRKKVNEYEEKELLVRYDTKPGFPGMTIVEEAEQRKCDLIVMSTSKRSKIGQRIIGSTAVYVARHSKIPVLFLPNNYSFSAIKRILISVKPGSVFQERYRKPIEFLQKGFNAKIELMSIISENEFIEKNTITAWAKELKLPESETHYFKIGGESISHSLLDTIEIGVTDLLITLPKKHTITEKLFDENITKELAYHSSIPVLTLHE
jgi:nucleotide-binding universal stress UspA family protein